MAGIRLALALALVAGCTDDAVILDIDVGTTPTTEVELVIAEQLLAGKTVQGPAGTLPNPVVWTRDTTVRTVATVVAGHAKFRIEPGDQNATPTIVAIGFADETATGEVVVEALPVDRPGIYLATLAAATPSSTPGSGPHLDVWSNDPSVRTGREVCISITGDRAIVPTGDPDCDGFVAPNECPGADFIYRDDQPATVTSIRDASCLGLYDLSGANGTNLGTTCRIGGTGCTDGNVAQATTCLPAPICLPDAACACNGIDLPCFETQLFGPANAPNSVVIECTVPLTIAGAACNALTVPVHLPGQRACSGEQYLTLPIAAPVAFQTELRFASGARFIPAAQAGSCNIDLTMHDPPAPQTSGIYPPERAVIDYRASNGFDVLIPLRLTYVTGDQCTTISPSCSVDATTTNGVVKCFADGAHP